MTGWILAGGAAGLTIVVFMASTDARCTWDYLREDVSSDGRHTAAIYRRTCVNRLFITSRHEVLRLQTLDDIQAPQGSRLPDDTILMVDDLSLSRSPQLWIAPDTLRVELGPYTSVGLRVAKKDGIYLRIIKPRSGAPKSSLGRI